MLRADWSPESPCGPRFTFPTHGFLLFISFLKEEAKFNEGVWLVGAGVRCLGRAGSLGEGPSCTVVTLTTSSTCPVCCDPITSHLSMMWASPDTLCPRAYMPSIVTALSGCLTFSPTLSATGEGRKGPDPPPQTHTSSLQGVPSDVHRPVKVFCPGAPLPPPACSSCGLPARVGGRWGRAGAGQVACREA